MKIIMAQIGVHSSARNFERGFAYLLKSAVMQQKETNIAADVKLHSYLWEVFVSAMPKPPQEVITRENYSRWMDK